MTTPMRWKKACCIYCIALLVAALINIEKISVWADEHLSDTPVASLTRQVRRVRNLWRDSSAGTVSKEMDCALAPFFDGTYKNTLSCKESPAQHAAEKALHDRLDPDLPVLKVDDPVDTAALQAILAPAPANGTRHTAGTEPVAEDKPAQAAENVPLPPANDHAPRKLLVVGDSLAIGLSLSLRRSVTEFENVELIEEGKVSSGLANPKYYDWGRALRVFLNKYSPDIVVIMMGANDAKYINPNEKPRSPGNPSKTWPEVFSMRMESFLDALNEKNIPSYWIGLPIMGDPTYAKQAVIMNEIIKAECAKAKNSHFLDTWKLLADDQGNYSTFLPNAKGTKIKVRANDKIHFTVAGGDILTQSFLSTIAKDMGLRPKKPLNTAGKTNAASASTAQ